MNTQQQPAVVSFPLPLFRQMVHLTAWDFFGPGEHKRPVIVNRLANAAVRIGYEQPDRVVFVHGVGQGGYTYAAQAYILSDGFVTFPC